MPVFCSAKTAGAAEEGLVATAAGLVEGCEPPLVTTSWRPSTDWVYESVRVRFITRRVRFAVCTRDTLRRTPSPASIWLRPVALTVSGRSIAIRGGLLTAKP